MSFKTLILMLITTFTIPLQALSEKEFFGAVRNKREIFKSGSIDFEYYYIRWNKDDYSKFIADMEECSDRTYTEVKACFLKRISKKLKERIFVSKYNLDSKIKYIYQSNFKDSEDLLPDKLYVKREYLDDSINNYLKHKLSKNYGPKKEDICKAEEYVFIKGKEYIEKCVFLDRGRYSESVRKELANKDNFKKILLASQIGWLSNIDRSFGAERIKVIASTYHFIDNGNTVIIKTKDGEMIFNADKSFSSRKVVGYYKTTKKISEEVLYGAYTSVNGIYIPFFISSSHFDEKSNIVETDFYLIEDFKLAELSENDFKINISSDTEVIEDKK